MRKTYDGELAYQRDYDELRQREIARAFRREQAQRQPKGGFSLADAHRKVGGDPYQLKAWLTRLTREERDDFFRATPQQAKQMFDFWGKQ